MRRAVPAIVLATEAARIYHRWPYALVADFRRDYGISRDELFALPITEFTMLALGLSTESRTVALRRESGPATASVPTEIPQDPDAYLASLANVRGVVRVTRSHDV
jgi:hypothetical protein